MIAHALRIGQTIYDINCNQWGEIKTIDGKTEDVYTSDENLQIVYDFEDAKGKNWLGYGIAKDIYPLAVNRSFKGEDVCWEINVDEFDDEQNYDYYCPNRSENCYDCEVDKY